MKDLRIGIVGSGGMGRVHRANWDAIAGAEVTALCGTSDHARRSAEEWGVACYRSIGEMVCAGAVDVVDICTPTFLHHEQVMESLRLGIDTICEKPLALHAADAREMFDAARQHGCHLYVAQVLQFTKEIGALRGLVQSGEYGAVLDASFERLSAAPRWAEGGWLFERERSGLLPFDLHIHDLDVIVSLFGRPKGFAANAVRGHERSYPEHLRVNYDYGAFHVQGEAAWFHAAIPWTARWRVCFENAVVICDGAGMTAYLPDGEPRVFETRDAVEISTGINVPPCGWYYNELSHFAECIRAGKDSPLVPREQILTVLEVLEEVEKWT